MDDHDNVDPLVAGAAAWIALNAELGETIRRSQSIETKLFAQAKAHRVPCEVACHSTLPEARTLRMLNRQIEVATSALEVEAHHLATVRATSVSGAVAKIRLGLAVQGPFDWRPSAFELLTDGLAGLNLFIRRDQGLTP